MEEDGEKQQWRSAENGEEDDPIKRKERKNINVGHMVVK